MVRGLRSILLCVLLFSITVPVFCARTAGTPLLHALIVDGQSGGTYHDWRVTTPVLQRELELSEKFDVTVATSPQWGTDFSSFHPDFSKYQVVVWNYDAPDWPENLRHQLEVYVSAGGGLIIVHAADNAFPNWREFNLMAGLGGWRDRTESAGPMWYYRDGKLVSDNSPGKAGSHGARLPFRVDTRAPEHPIMRGLPAAWMHVPDELYATLRGPGQNMTVLATAHSDPANKGTGHDEPIMVVTRYGKGRVFHTMMGHDVEALSGVGFLTTYQRGAEWAATGRVTQPVPAGFPTALVASYRVDIASMDPAFSKGVQTVGVPSSTPGVAVRPSQPR